MENLNEYEFLKLLLKSTLSIEDDDSIRIFKSIDSTKVYYKKIFKSNPNQYFDSVLDLQDALALYNLFS